MGVETLINASLTHALIASRAGNRARALAHARLALETAVNTGLVESFVFGYRGCPEIGVCLLEDASLHDELCEFSRSPEIANCDKSLGFDA